MKRCYPGKRFHQLGYEKQFLSPEYFYCNTILGSILHARFFAGYVS